jgi:hypothetical protein
MISPFKESVYKIGRRPFFVYYIKKPSTRT